MGLGDPKGGGGIVSVIFVPVSRDTPARVERANNSFLGEIGSAEYGGRTRNVVGRAAAHLLRGSKVRNEGGGRRGSRVGERAAQDQATRAWFLAGGG